MNDGFGTQELVILLVIVLVLFGGSRLPTLAQGLQKYISTFKQPDAASYEFHPTSIPFLLASGGVILIIMLNVTEAITGTQALVSIGVLFVWALTGWLLFRRKQK